MYKFKSLVSVYERDDYYLDVTWTSTYNVFM